MLTTLMLAIAGAQSPVVLDATLERWWGASSIEERDSIAEEILASGAGFGEVESALRNGRAYSKDAPTGRLLFEHEIGGVRHPYMVIVPEDYSPERRWPVRFDLHGGMGAKEWKKLDGSWSGGWTSARDEIMVFPAGWWDSMWWEYSQVQNFEAILRSVRATWNIDEDRVTLVGNSDGGAALFFHAMHNPDRWAGYAGFVAPPDRLTRKDFRPDGQSHVCNLAGQRFHLGYGKLDKLVPWKHASRYLELFEQHGAILDYYVLENRGHNLNLPDERLQEFLRFMRASRRDPLPDELTWATTREARYARRSWLVIDSLSEDRKLEDDSVILPRWGTAIQLRGPTVESLPFGRVDVARSGNRVTVTTSGVDELRLLVSEGDDSQTEFDLSQPIVVELNGKVVHEAKVEPALKTLLYWAARDDDRKRLFAAEIELVVRSQDGEEGSKRVVGES